MKIPESQNTIDALIDHHHEAQLEGPREHLGCSLLGHHCDRWLWLSFRWAVVEKFNGRMLRLFRRGQNEEATVVSDLRAIGIDVTNTGNSQTRVNFGCHVSGSIDGIINSGVPEAPKAKHVLEIKTHGLKSFNGLLKDGVEKGKPMHYAQMQLYMHGMKIDRALYFAVCKDSDEIYTERVRYVKEVAEKLVARGHRITLAERLPEPASADPTWFQCKYCPAHDFCFESKCTKEVNCRTCAHSTPTPESTWTCARYDGAVIPGEHQRQGCPCHVLHPDLVPWKWLESKSEWNAVYEVEGKRIENGEPCANVFGSRELLANMNACLNQDEVIEYVRTELDGVIIE